MTRRDTIVIAVLINAGLLIVLFSTALKSDGAQEEYAYTPSYTPPQVIEAPVRKELPVMSGDEVDRALEKVSEPVVIAPPPAPTFADDLKAITLPEVVQALPAPVIQAESNAIEVKVKKGDVLEKIARNHGTSVSEIMKLNHLTNTNLRIGQTLKIPKKGAFVSAPVPSQSDAKTYVVKKGDNPWTIAVKNHMKVEELLKLNNLSEEQARRLKPGDELRIQ
ncbi:MAG: LysM peptidoglycan-binding domain-containing protein [Verrucomicrobia bacterium]|nr:LysM peptidoglycan-binding domain-containing protein [Verrucomicrobiota bacterium]